VSAFQTLCLFVSGYLASRLLVRLRYHHRIVARLINRFRSRPELVLLSLMAGCATLSLILPNALTVLAVLPIIELVVRRAGADRREASPSDGVDEAARSEASQKASPGDSYDTTPPPSRRLRERWSSKSMSPEDKALTTALVLAVIYGANIGGSGSVTGSPANLYLLVTLEVLELPGRQALHFVSWLVFGVPLVVVLLIPAWRVLVLFTKRETLDRLAHLDPGEPTDAPHKRVREAGAGALLLLALLHAAALAAGALVASREVFTLALASFRYTITMPDILMLGVTLLTMALLLATRVPVTPYTTGGRRHRTVPLLRLTDLVGHVPWRGIALAGAALAIVFAVAYAGGERALEYVSTHWIPSRHGAWALTAAMVVMCIFSTELLSNTTAATLLFPTAAVIGRQMSIDPLPVAVGVSIASTCAFMSPIATPVNALAFGSMKGTRLRTMLQAGGLVNLTSAVVITLWAQLVVPLVLSWFR
jgi:sodium-dependent dicarboxylate transporter 2/3/5